MLEARALGERTRLRPRKMRVGLDGAVGVADVALVDAGRVLEVADLDDSAVGSVWHGSAPLIRVSAQARWCLRTAGPLDAVSPGSGC